MSVKNGINGWAGTVLRVNLTTGAITKEDTLLFRRLLPLL